MASMRRLIFLVLVASALTLGGCVILRSASISDSAGRGNAVSAQASDMGYLWLVAPDNLTQTAASRLTSGCASGKVTDAQTELSVRDFLGIVQMYQVNATGACL
jgi:hypothetical protein